MQDSTHDDPRGDAPATEPASTPSPDGADRPPATPPGRRDDRPSFAAVAKALRREVRERRRRERDLAHSLERAEARLAALRAGLAGALGIADAAPPDADAGANASDDGDWTAAAVEAAGRVRDALVRRAFDLEAARAGVRAPASAFKVADFGAVRVSASGDVEGVAEAVERLRESDPYFFDPRAEAPSTAPAGFNPGRRPEPAIAPEVRREAEHFGLPPQVWSEIRERRRARKANGALSGSP